MISPYPRLLALPLDQRRELFARLRRLHARGLRMGRLDAAARALMDSYLLKGMETR